MAGLTNNSIFAVFPQIASRVLIVYTTFPYIKEGSVAITLTVFMWCTIELIRYPFYTVKSLDSLKDSSISRFYGHLRYNAFIVVYPLGTTGEMLGCREAYEAVKDWKEIPF